VAVYERTWRPYAGPTTPVRGRWLVVTRYALAEAFSSRIFTAFYAACFLPSLLGVFLIYLSHNLGLLEQLGLTREFMGGLTLVFFRLLFLWQAIPGFFLMAILAPSLIAPDLANSALPLYLSRPIDRRDYVLGKLAVIFVVVSPPTWMMGLALFLLQTVEEGRSWGMANWRIGLAYLLGHLVWILVISLLALAISVWVRFRPAALGALFALLFVLSAFGSAVNGITRSSIGDVVHLTRAIASVVQHLFGAPTSSGLPVAVNWLTLAAVALLSLWVLRRKLRAHEVVR
jgi:ABC-2 type transport system permease protein